MDLLWWGFTVVGIYYFFEKGWGFTLVGIYSGGDLLGNPNYEEYSVDHDLALRKLLDPLNTMILSLTDAEDYIFTDHPPPQLLPQEPEEPEELEEQD